ncbi:hypothetical protein [Streptomyces sp. 891-h]|uniref:hypothetical protein n=1 Tax=Streptomyces sp. 891-h TaxID=2720714 RepID=UPI001FAA751F|nr:hypothetical protein [Streptomyces sp. 891-h]UNZ20623.1 hypothetical protein HC362_29725 [Streptomyces sp. 891-h]
MAIVTLDAAKEQLNIATSDSSQDVELQRYVDAVTTPVERHLGEVVDQRQLTDELRLSGATSFMLSGTPVISLDAVATVDGTQIWAVADMHVDSASGEVTVLSGPAVTGLVAVTYTAGYATVPEDYQLAALIIVQHLWETQRGAMGVSVGGEGEPVFGLGFALPRRALELLGTPLPGVA